MYDESADFVSLDADCEVIRKYYLWKYKELESTFSKKNSGNQRNIFNILASLNSMIKY